MVRALVVAAGGGGDVISAVVAGHRLGVDVAAVLSYSWDRLMLDPAPGPRTRADFVGGVEPAPGVYEILGGSRLRSGARPTLPAVAAVVRERVLLLDPVRGAAGLSTQITAAAKELAADEVIVVDVGGDILATGGERGLRTPLADSLALAASVRSGLPVRLLVAGVGLDGELSGKELAGRLAVLGAESVFTFAAGDFDRVRELFVWHPSEANGLLAAAAAGIRGRVETRQGDGMVVLTDAAIVAYEFDANRVLAASLAAHLVGTEDLDAVERVIRMHRGSSEIDYERQRLAEVSTSAAYYAHDDALRTIDQYSDRAARAGVDYLTLRRVAELAYAMDPVSGARLRALLAASRPDRYLPPLYRTR
ncbi:DUF1152 domain-containing protein [Nocardia sp. NPDC005978]|uniref:DUF1152 domain-containing protein n=1 Tax=Nocardia sp. NPDC005978 TaxID=3156725 RepID=UPI0033B73CBC